MALSTLRHRTSRSHSPQKSLIQGILLDADALVALFKTNDSNHKTALRLSHSLELHGIDYYASPFTIAEAATVFSYKTSHQTAKSFLKQVRKLNIPTLELKNQKLADKWFLKQSRKGTAYFDCYNLALLDHFHKQLSAIFSFDKIYKQNGFTLLQDLKL